MTTCYTFKVTMTVQVLSEEDAERAQASLDQNGGFVSKREVELIQSTSISEEVKASLSVVKGETE